MLKSSWLTEYSGMLACLHSINQSVAFLVLGTKTSLSYCQIYSIHILQHNQLQALAHKLSFA